MEKLYEIEKTRVNFQLFKDKDFTDDILHKLALMSNGYVVCWLHYAVLFGKIRNKKIEFYKNQMPDFNKYLLKLRAFNGREELHVWKGKKYFNFRYIKEDEQGDKELEFIDAKQVMFGTKFKKLDEDFYEVWEDRGIRYIIPAEIIPKQLESEIRGRLVLHTRNYIGYNPIGQAGFIDSQFIKLEFRGD